MGFISINKVLEYDARIVRFDAFSLAYNIYIFICSFFKPIDTYRITCWINYFLNGVFYFTHRSEISVEFKYGVLNVITMFNT